MPLSTGHRAPGIIATPWLLDVSPKHSNQLLGWAGSYWQHEKQLKCHPAQKGVRHAFTSWKIQVGINIVMNPHPISKTTKPTLNLLYLFVTWPQTFTPHSRLFLQPQRYAQSWRVKLNQNRTFSHLTENARVEDNVTRGAVKVCNPFLQ